MTRIYGATLLALLCFGVRPAAGVEVVSIPSQNGKLKLPGYWFPAAGAEPRPAVISLHGCGGLLDENGQLSRNRYRVAEYFNVEKMHMLLLDSFTPRGEKSICETPISRRAIQFEDRREDVFAAIQWLARRPAVDRTRIAVLGYSNGGGTVLSVLDRTDKAVQSQSIQPRAAIAYYPSCQSFVNRLHYEISAPLLLMIGEQDEWTQPHQCERLHARVKREQPGATFDFVLYPGSHHGFDGYEPLKIRTGLPTFSGKAAVGANPAARDQSLRRMFDFLSAQLAVPLALTHEERLYGHRYVVPPASRFAGIGDVAAVPLSEKGRARYQHYLGLDAPKAFAITEKGGWDFRSADPEAMQVTLGRCQKANVRCWLYAVDDRVVWSSEAAVRIDRAKLQRKAR